MLGKENCYGKQEKYLKRPAKSHRRNENRTTIRFNSDRY